MTRARRLFGTVIGLASLAVLVAPANACRSTENGNSIFWGAIPTAAADTVIAEVEILTDTGVLPDVTFEARIISMFQGSYSGSRLVLKPQRVSSCDWLPTVGAKGIVVGRVLSLSDDGLIIDPIRAPSQAELDLQTPGSFAIGPGSPVRIPRLTKDP